MKRIYKNIENDQISLEEFLQELLIIISSYLGIKDFYYLVSTSKTLHGRLVTYFQKQLNAHTSNTSNMSNILVNYINYYCVYSKSTFGSINDISQYYDASFINNSMKETLYEVKKFIRELYDKYVMENHAAFSRQDIICSVLTRSGDISKQYIAKYTFHINNDDPSISQQNIIRFMNIYYQNFYRKTKSTYLVEPELEFIDIDKEYYCKTVAIKIEFTKCDKFYVIFKYYKQLSKNAESNLLTMISYQDNYSLVFTKDSMKILNYNDVIRYLL